MIFKSKIFIPDNKWYNKYALSTKLLALSFIGVTIMGIVIAITGGKLSNDILEKIFQVFIFSTVFIPLLISMIIPPFEYEIFNGKFGASLSISEEEIVIDSTKYLLTEIKEFEVKILSFYGMRTNQSRRYGPSYHQGINNKISIRVSDEIIDIFFFIKTEGQFEKLQKIIYKIILNEQIRFKYKYLDYISDNLKLTNEYKSFILQLKNEKRLIVK